MNQNRKFFNYLISTILSLVGVLAIFCTWNPLFLTIFNNTSTPPSGYGTTIPMKVVGVNYPTITFVWLGISLVIFLFVLFLLSKKRKVSSGLFWLNGIAVSIILSHIIIWIVWVHPFGLFT